MGNDQLLRNPHSWPRFQPGDDMSGHGHNSFFVRAPTGVFTTSPQTSTSTNRCSHAGSPPPTLTATAVSISRSRTSG